MTTLPPARNTHSATARSSGADPCSAAAADVINSAAASSIVGSIEVSVPKLYHRALFAVAPHPSHSKKAKEVSRLSQAIGNCRKLRRRRAEYGLDYLEGGDTLEDFLAGFPTVSRAVALEALEEAEQLLLADV